MRRIARSTKLRNVYAYPIAYMHIDRHVLINPRHHQITSCHHLPHHTPLNLNLSPRSCLRVLH